MMLIGEIEGWERDERIEGDFDCRILEYRGTRGYNWLRPISTAEEY